MLLRLATICTATYRNYSNMILYLLTDLPRYNWCTIYCILVYNFTSFTYVYIHDCITTINTCTSPPKPSSSLTLLPDHSQATMVTLYFPEMYICSKITLHVLILVCFPTIGIIILTFTHMYNPFHFIAEWDPIVWAEHNLFIY